jgi:hypothetical protein
MCKFSFSFCRLFFCSLKAVLHLCDPEGFEWVPFHLSWTRSSRTFSCRPFLLLSYWTLSFLSTQPLSLILDHPLPSLQSGLGRQGPAALPEWFCGSPKECGGVMEQRERLWGHRLKQKHPPGATTHAWFLPLSCRWRCVCVQVLRVPRDRVQPCGQAVLHCHPGLQQCPHSVCHTQRYVSGVVGRWGPRALQVSRITALAGCNGARP